LIVATSSEFRAAPSLRHALRGMLFFGLGTLQLEACPDGFGAKSEGARGAGTVQAAPAVSCILAQAQYSELNASDSEESDSEALYPSAPGKDRQRYTHLTIPPLPEPFLPIMLRCKLSEPGSDPSTTVRARAARRRFFLAVENDSFKEVFSL
jgi:hypothetical protein